VTVSLGALWHRLAAARHGAVAFISGATGAAPATAEERAFLDAHPELAVRATGTHIGHGVEPQFVMNIALAALAVKRGKLFASHNRFDDRFERAMADAPAQAVVSGVGHGRGEGLALVEAIEP
jgi:3-oxoacyl-[acyl-carrier-protein] synthase II